MRDTEENNLDVADESFDEDIDRGYVFIHGMGFVDRDPVKERQNQVRRVSTFLGLSIIVYLLLANLSFDQMTLGGDQLKISAFAAILLGGLGFYLSYSIPFGLFGWFLGVPYKTLARRGTQSKSELWLMVALSVGFGAVLQLCVAVFRIVFTGVGLVSTPFDLLVPTTNSVGALLLTGVVTVVLEPLVKEVVFHGIMMKALKNFGNFFALSTTSILCAVMQSTLDGALTHFLCAMFIGYFVVRFDDLRVGIAMHMSYSAHRYITQLVTWSMGESGRGIVYLLNILLLIVCIVCYIKLMGMWRINDRLLKSEDILTLKQRYGVFFTTAPMLVAIFIFGLQMISTINLF